MPILSKRASLPVDQSWLATSVALLQLAHPAVRVDRRAVSELLEYLTWQWRQGRTAREAVAMTCAAGGRITPSAGTTHAAPSVRPPKNAQPGEAFGADEVRQSVAVGRIDIKIEALQGKLSDAKQRANLYAQRAAVTKSSARRQELIAKEKEADQKVVQLTTQLAEARAERKERARTVDGWQQVSKPTPRAPKRSGSASTRAACPPSRKGCELGLIGGSCGLPASLVLASARGAPIPQAARFCLTSADRLIPSHDARRGFTKRADYPEDVQEREYDRDKAEQYKVISTAQNLIPELIFNGAPGAIDGLPVVTKEGIVLGGNGRTQALQLHYSQAGHSARDYLLDNAAQFGFTAEDVAALSDPVVVRVIQTPDVSAPQFQRAAQELVRLLNVPLTQSLGVRAESVAESRRLTDEVLEILSVALSDSSLAEYLASRASRSLVDALRRAGILTERNAGRLLNPDGLFSEDGKRTVERLITAAVIPDAALLDRLGSGTVATLAAGAPWILSAAASGNEWDLRKPLRAAAQDLADLRGRDIESVDGFLRQGGFFGKPATADSPEGQSLLRLLFDLARQPTRFRAFARRFAALASQNPINQSSLFETESVSPSQALHRALEAK